MSHSDSPGAGTDPGRTVLVTGSGGFLGRAAVRSFAAAGYEVRGLVREESRAVHVREDGGIPVLGSVLDEGALAAAVRGCRGIVHLAANPSGPEDPRSVRVDGTRRLVAAALRAGARRLVVGSGYWVYRGQPGTIDERSPVEPQGESQVNYDAERAGLDANRPDRFEVLVVRPGMVYGNGSWFGDLASAVRDGTYRVVGDGANRWSFVGRSDAGDAFRTVLEAGSAGEVYNVTDGVPVTLRSFVDLVATAVGVPEPPSIAIAEAEREFGPVIAHHLAADRAASNEKLTKLGWRPRVREVRSGVPPLLAEMFGGPGPGEGGRAATGPRDAPSRGQP